MNSEIFGKCAWPLLHFMTQWNVRKDKISNDQKENICVVGYSLAMILPCVYCRESYRRYIQCIDIQTWIQNRPATTFDLTFDDVEYWWFLIHNLVNQKLKKPWLRDFSQVAPQKMDATLYALHLVEWLCMITLNLKETESNFVYCNQNEKMVTEKALIKLSKQAQRNQGYFVTAANKYNVTLGTLLDKVVFDVVYKRYLHQNTNISKCEWRKIGWYIFFVAHLRHFFLTNSNIDFIVKNIMEKLYEVWVLQAHLFFCKNEREKFDTLFQIGIDFNIQKDMLEEGWTRFQSYKAH